MAKLERLWRKLAKLKEKKEVLEFDIDEVESEIRFWQAMEDDKADWSKYEDF